MQQILLIQFRKDTNLAKREKILFEQISNCKLRAVNTFHRKLIKNDFSEISHIIIGGSGDFSFSKRGEFALSYEKIKKMNLLITKSIENNIPILGVCLGHQYLGHLLGSEIVGDRRQEEIGTFEVRLTAKGLNDPLFKNIPGKFFAQQGHRDVVDILPKNCTLLATSKTCEMQSFKLNGKNVYGVQFHPELDKKENKKRALLAGVQGVFLESPLASRVIRNFIRLRQT